PPLPNDIEITPDGKTIYVAHGFGSEDLSVIEPISQTRIEGIPVPGFRPHRITLSQDGQKLYLNSEISPRIAALDLASKVLTDSLEVGEPTDVSRRAEDVALSQDGTRLYAAVSRILPDPISQFVFSGVLWIIDTATFTKIGEILIGAQIGTISISPDGKTAYIAGSETFDLTSPNPNLQVFLVDLEENTNLGPLRGFILPVAIEFGAGKPALPRVVWPEIVVF
ncbi:MAG: hypothetical protein O7G87_08440, partial [bacterium]|nr:hypothetical protein [bacterium]